MSVYRQPCGGGRERQWPLRSGCFQHKRAADKRVQKYANVTAVPNPTCPDDWDPSFTPSSWPATVNPYLRPPTTGDSEIVRRTDGKVPTDPDYCDEGHDHGIPPGPWKKSDFPSSCFDGATQIDLNCYSIVPGEYVNLSSCFKMGFKNVQSRHFWHGRFGFESLDGPTTCGVDAADMPATPDGARYLTVRCYALSSQTNEGDPDSDYSYEFDRTFTVDRITGVITQTGPGWTISTTHGNTDPPDGSFVADVFNKAMGFGALYCAPNYDSTYIYGPIETHPTETQTINETSTFDRSNTSITHTLTYVGTGESPSDNSVQTHIESATLSNPFTAGELVFMTRQLLAQWDMANDRIYPWRTDPFTTVAPLVELDGVRGVVDPMVGSPYGEIGQGADGWIDPNAALFDGAILGRPLPFPGVTAIVQDGGTDTEFFGPGTAGILAGTELQLKKINVTILAAELRDGDGVLLATGVEGDDFSYDSRTGLVTILTDSNLIIDNTFSPNQVWINYSFDVEGGGHFDPHHETWHYGPDACGSEIECLKYYGAWSGALYAADITDAYVPRCATHWTQNNQAQDLPHGAFQIYSAATGELIMQKWAEIKLPRPSQNYFGPCGAARYEVKAANTSCVANDVGDPPVLTVSMGEGDRFTAGDRVLYWNGTTAAEYTVASVDGDDVQLSAKVADAPATFEGGPLLGVLRWAEGEAWPICARVPLAGITENLGEDDLPDGTLTVTLASPAPYLRAGDLVDFTTGDNATAVHTSQTVLSVLSDTTFTIDATAYGTFDPLDATHVKSTGAPGYWWYDVRPQGDFIFAEWGFNFRDMAIDPAIRPGGAAHGMQEVSEFFATTDCLPFTPCFPQVMCITPNHSDLDDASIDDFPNGITYDFGDLTPDGRYGAQWQAIIQQVMDDIYWAAPITPCSIAGDEFGDYSACTSAEDDGSCQADTCAGVGDGGKFYYAHRPLVEARAAAVVPWRGDSAPTLPDGIVIGYATLDEIEGDIGDKPVLLPPAPVGGQNNRLDTPNPTAPQWCPWSLYITQQACVCSGGRFAEDYKQDGVIC